MLSEIKTKKVSWINAESPTKEEIAELQKKYGLHILVAEELLQPTIRPKADFYENLVYLILHFPVYNITSRHALRRLAKYRQAWYNISNAFPYAYD